MRILRLDSTGGASGDMLLGLFVALGADPKELERELAPLFHESFAIEAAPCRSWAISGIRLKVNIDDHHDHDHDHEDSHHHHHHHRSFASIRAKLATSPLPPEVIEESIAVFRLLAAAEGKIHGVPIEEVSFHEVGAIDSIVDIVGCCLARHRLKIDAFALSPIPVGSGTVRCRHGLYPVPAPATAELLALGRIPVASSLEQSELLTPTGAALLSHWPQAEPPRGARVAKAVNSFGQRELKTCPNLLRGMLFEAVPAAGQDTVEEFACNLDDCTPEVAGHLMERLFEAGALDVWFEAISMKKQRPGSKLGVLAPPESHEAILGVIFAESTTFGVRWHTAERRILERDFCEVETPYGRIPLKTGRLNGIVVTEKPEYEICRKIAREKGIPLKEVLRAALTGKKIQ